MNVLPYYKAILGGNNLTKNCILFTLHTYFRIMFNEKLGNETINKSINKNTKLLNSDIMQYHQLYGVRKFCVFYNFLAKTNFVLGSDAYIFKTLKQQPLIRFLFLLTHNELFICF